MAGAPAPLPVQINKSTETKMYLRNRPPNAQEPAPTDRAKPNCNWALAGDEPVDVQAIMHAAYEQRNVDIYSALRRAMIVSRRRFVQLNGARLQFRLAGV